MSTKAVSLTDHPTFANGVRSLPWRNIAILVLAVALAAIGGILLAIQAIPLFVSCILWGFAAGIIVLDLILWKSSSKSKSEKRAAASEKGPKKRVVDHHSASTRRYALQRGGIQREWGKFKTQSQFSQDLWKSVRRLPETNQDWDELQSYFVKAIPVFDAFFDQSSSYPKGMYEELKKKITSPEWRSNVRAWFDLKNQQYKTKDYWDKSPYDIQVEQFTAVPKSNEVRYLKELMQAVEHFEFRKFIDCLYKLTMFGEEGIENRSGALAAGIRFMRQYRYERDPRLAESQRRTSLTGVGEDAFSWITTTYFHVGVLEDITYRKELRPFSFPPHDPPTVEGRTLIAKICGTGFHFTNYVKGLNSNNSHGSNPIFLANEQYQKASGIIDWTTYCRPSQEQNNCFLVSSWVNFAVFLRYLEALGIDASQFMGRGLS